MLKNKLVNTIPNQRKKNLVNLSYQTENSDIIIQCCLNKIITDKIELIEKIILLD